MRTEINGGRYPIQRSPITESTTNLPQLNNWQPADTTQMLPVGHFLPTTTQNSEVEYPTDFENHYGGNSPFLKPFAQPNMGISLQQQFTDIRYT